MKKRALQVVVCCFILSLSIPTIVGASGLWNGHSDSINTEQNIDTIDALLDSREKEILGLKESHSEYKEKALAMDVVLNSMSGFFNKKVTLSNYNYYLTELVRYAKIGKTVWPWSYSELSEKTEQQTIQISSLEAENTALEEELAQTKELLNEKEKEQERLENAVLDESVQEGGQTP